MQETTGCRKHKSRESEMAPVDEAIAKARLERKKTMEQGLDSLTGRDGTVGGPMTPDVTAPFRAPSILEQLEKSASYHFEEHTRAQQGASFLKAHPEFEEFLRLFRSGVLGVIVLSLCVVAALAQPDPVLSTADRV